MNKIKVVGLVAGVLFAGAACTSQPTVTGQCVDKYIEYTTSADSEPTVVLKTADGNKHHINTNRESYDAIKCGETDGQTVNSKKDLELPDED